MRRRLETKIRSTLLAAAGLAAALAVAAQDDDEARRHGVFVDTVDVRLVNVEVLVTRDGKAVADLTASDFEIFDDGEPVEITYFSRVEGGRRVAAGEGVLGGATPRQEIPGKSSLVILVDQFLLSPGGRKQVFDQLSQHLDRLMSDDTQVMVVEKGLSVEVALAPTSDRAEVRAALARLAGRATKNPAGDIRSAIRGIQRLEQVSEEGELLVEAMARSSFDRARWHSQEVHHQILKSLDLLDSLVGSLAALSGRKAVLYLADRLPVRPAEDVWRVWFEAYGEDFGPQFGVTSVPSATEEFDVSGELRRLVTEASTSRVAFYPIGVGRSFGDVSSAESALLVGRSDPSEEGLLWLAAGTCGQAAVGRFEAEAFFDRLRQDLTHYYSLAYPSPHGGDGKAHRIEVKVRRDDVEVRYFGGYRDPSHDQQAVEFSLASLQFGVAANPLDVEVALGEPEKQKGGRFALPLEANFPIANLVLLPGRKTHDGKISIRVVARDEKGRTSEPVTAEVPIEIPHADMLRASSRKVRYKARLTLRKGRQTIAVEVRDEVGSVSSTVLVEVDVGGRG